jgi:hypothetical protein
LSRPRMLPSLASSHRDCASTRYIYRDGVDKHGEESQGPRGNFFCIRFRDRQSRSSFHRDGTIRPPLPRCEIWVTRQAMPQLVPIGIHGVRGSKYHTYQRQINERLFHTYRKDFRFIIRSNDTATCLLLTGYLICRCC